MKTFNGIKHQIEELIFKISNISNVPYSLVRTIERDVKTSTQNDNIEELEEIKSKLESLARK